MTHPPALWRLQTYEEVGSTQDLALAAARAGEPGRLAILARRQTAGRGRAGRAWDAPEGNLNFSALLRPHGVMLAGEWSLLAGVAMFEAAAAFAPGAHLLLKWPNDLLFGQGKVGGVLIDSAMAAGGSVDWVVIGVGVNLIAAPALEGRAAACLKDSGATVTPQDLATRLMLEIDRWQAAGFASVRQAWLERTYAPGTWLSVRVGAAVVEGAFLGLTDDGRLRLEGREDIASGEILCVGPG